MEGADLNQVGLGECEVEPMYARYAKEFHMSEKTCEIESKLLRRINRFIVYYFGAYLCNVDLEASRCQTTAAEDSFHHGRSNTNNWRLVPLRQSRWKRHLRFNWIPQVLLASFILCELYLLLSAYFQYQYDFDVLRLHELQRRWQRGEGGGITQNYKAKLHRQNEQQLFTIINSRIEQTKVTLDLLGSDYSHMTILAGCFYMCIVPLAFLLHMPIYLHHRFQRPFDQCHIVRDLLDQRRENELTVRMVDSQVFKFLQSNRIYHENMVAFQDTPLGVWQAGTKLAINSLVQEAKQQSTTSSYVNSAGGSASASASAPWHCCGEIPEMVREMLASGALVPLYKLRAWVRERTLMQFGYLTSMLFFSLSFHLTFVGCFYLLASHERSTVGHLSTTYHSLLIQIACLGPLVLSTPTNIVHPPILMVVVREQCHYIRQLRCMISQCIEQNSKIAQQISRLRNRLPSPLVTIGTDDGDSAQRAYAKVALNRQMEIASLERTLNSNLIFVLLHYKIYVAQLTPMRLTLGVMNAVALVILFTVPIIVRLHIPYLRQLYEDRLTAAQIRIFSVVISGSVFIPINMLTAPIAHMFARCEGLYRDLASLMAHISEVKSHPGCSRIYDSHAQSCLLKELSDSKRLLEQLTVRASGVSGTFTNLIRALFWYGLLLVSIMADNSYSNSGNRELLGSLFSDPLRVYDEIEKIQPAS